MNEDLTIRGRSFNNRDLLVIRTLVKRFYQEGRSEISKQICIKLNWRQPNGWLKDRACRDVLLRLSGEGIIKLPPSKTRHRIKQRIQTEDSAKKWLSDMPVITEYFKPKFRMVKGTQDEKIWNELVRIFHYQSYSVIVGHNIKYLAYSGDVPVACLGWGSAAWAVEVRDRWLEDKFGWQRDEIIENLPRIINNVRFLILPWVHVTNLASTILAMMEGIVKNDWKDYYDIEPILFETFVEKSRFNGTCYKAANWIYIGATKGNGKKGNSWITHNNIKDMFIRPLSVK
jgi:hypothetical protein